LLLFYGDHLPALPLLYEGAGFDDGAKGPEQPVPWLLLDSARPDAVARIDTASFYLPGLLLDVAGIGDQPYFRLLEAVRRTDAPADGWQPAEDEGLAAAMRLRQEGAFAAAVSDLPPPSPNPARDSALARRDADKRL
jgi:hypothetical protein